MNRVEIMEKLTEIFADVFDDDTIEINENTTAKDVDGWDSLVHLTLISSIEDEFEIEFGLGEINSFDNVGEMIESIEKHING